MSELLYQKIANQLAEEHGVIAGQMFGKPCLKSNGKAFAAFFKGEMVFKLGQKEIELLIKKYIGSTNWDPSGKKRPMKDWLQIPEEYGEDWMQLSLAAMKFLDS